MSLINFGINTRFSRSNFVSLDFSRYNIRVFLDSSAVEHSAVNRTVTGSNPVQGVFYKGLNYGSIYKFV